MYLNRPWTLVRFGFFAALLAGLLMLPAARAWWAEEAPAGSSARLIDPDDKDDVEQDDDESDDAAREDAAEEDTAEEETTEDKEATEDDDSAGQAADNSIRQVVDEEEEGTAVATDQERPAPPPPRPVRTPKTTPKAKPRPVVRKLPPVKPEFLEETDDAGAKIEFIIRPSGESTSRRIDDAAEPPRPDDPEMLPEDSDAPPEDSDTLPPAEEPVEPDSPDVEWRDPDQGPAPDAGLPPGENFDEPVADETDEIDDDVEGDVEGDEAAAVPPEPTGRKIEPATLNGVTPGKSTISQVRKGWGQPIKASQNEKRTEHVYRLDPFEHVTVTFHDNVVATVVVQLKDHFPAEVVARELGLAELDHTQIIDDRGEALGQVYPERGVTLRFVGGVAGHVSKIVLEPIGGGPFALRAESHLTDRFGACLADLDQAIEFEPTFARAHWLKARLLSGAGRYPEALSCAREAVRLDPEDPRYRLTLSKALDQAGEYGPAVEEAKQVIARQGLDPEIKARAHCLLGDLLAAGPQHDYQHSAEHHTQAIRLAQKLITDHRATVQQAAREILIDAHLAIAYDVAWGNWKDKKLVAAKWLDKAAVLAKDAPAEESDAIRFRVATQALAVIVGLQGELDPGLWADSAVKHGETLIEAATDPLRKQQAEWELGMAMYDCVQVYHMRRQFGLALKYGKLAVVSLKSGSAGREDTPGFAYLLGRLYFRMGVIHAIHNEDHEEAVAWFDRALPLVEQPVARSAWGDIGRQGETLVSMAVSYWETGERERAIELTTEGIALLRKAIGQDLLPGDALNVPYANLAFMHRGLGHSEEAQHYEELAGRQKGLQR